MITFLKSQTDNKKCMITKFSFLVNFGFANNFHFVYLYFLIIKIVQNCPKIY